MVTGSTSESIFHLSFSHFHFDTQLKLQPSSETAEQFAFDIELKTETRGSTEICHDTGFMAFVRTSGRVQLAQF